MKLLHRVGYYLGGFSVGLIFLAFFLSGKRTSCDYSPNARVLKSIRVKPHKYSNNLISAIQSNEIDSLAIEFLLLKGNVNFSESDTKLDSCNIYVIEETYNKADIKLSVKNCEVLAHIDIIK